MSSPSQIADGLIADMKALEATVYEEVGVPALFVGEDLTAPAANPAGDPNPLGTRLAAVAAAVIARQPDFADADVGKLVQLFTERAFAGTPETVDAPEPLPAGAPRTLTMLIDGLAAGRAIHAVNFHATPSYRRDEYRRQIAAYAEAFEPITPANFDDAVTGRWPHARPGLMPLLFEGFRDNLDVLLPILEEHGFTAWLVVPSAFLGIPADEQRTYAAARELDPALTDEYPGERIALTWDEARQIAARGHAFACHSRNHSAVKPDTPLAVLEDEIVAAKAEMETELGRPVDIFCWLGGTATGVNPQADRLLREAGFRYLLSAFRIQKLR